MEIEREIKMHGWVQMKGWVEGDTEGWNEREMGG